MHDDDAVVASVGDDEVAHVVHSDALWPHELPVATPLTPQDPGRSAVGVDHEDMVHVKVRDYDVSVVIKCDPTWRVKVSAEVSLVTKLPQEYSIVAEDEKSMVACVGDSYSPVKLIYGYIIRVYHLAVIATLRAKHEQESAVYF